VRNAGFESSSGIVEGVTSAASPSPVTTSPAAGAGGSGGRRGRRVAVQASSRLLRQGLFEALDSCAGASILGVVEGPEELMELCRSGHPDTVVLELRADCLEAGVAAIQAVGQLERPVRMVLLASGSEAEKKAAAMADLGCSVFVSTRSGVGALWKAMGLRPVIANGWGPVARSPGRRTTLPLTIREREVLSHLSEGFRTSEIAERLGVSRKTVENHKQHLFAKLQVQNETSAVVTAGRRHAVSVAGGNAGRFGAREGPRVVIGDRTLLVRELVRRSCRCHGLDVVGETSTHSATVAACRARSPDVALLADPLAGESAEATIGLLTHMDIPVVVLSEAWSADRVLRLLAAGATGFVMYDASVDELAQAVTVVAGGGGILHPKAARLVLSQWRGSRATERGDPAGLLTRREMQVLGAMADGLGSKAVAYRLKIAVKTVESHKRSIFEKLGTHTQAHAVALALSRGFTLPFDTVSTDEAPAAS
jgi:NarL family two-component system response regulator YdfI